MKTLVTKQKYFNPETGKLVGYVRAKTLGLIPGSVSKETLVESNEDFQVETVRITDL